MVTFYRGNYGKITIVIRSSKELGLLGTGYIEDYNGVEGQISLLHVETQTRFAVPVANQPAMTPGIANDYFLGTRQLSDLPNGAYQLQFRVKDMTGNYVISGAVASPLGTELLSTLELTVLPGMGKVYTVPAVPRTTRRRELVVVLGS